MELVFRRIADANLGDAIALLRLYGAYMYGELGLTAGKATFDRQLNESLVKEYGIPGSEFLLAYVNDRAVACVGLRKFDEYSCELKRMFVLPRYRNNKIGTALIRKAVESATTFGYRRILLDTNREMEAALHLYEKHGFRQISPYCENENKNVVYLSRTL